MGARTGAGGKNGADAPGPGGYNPDSNMVKPNAGGTLFGKGARPGLNGKADGPGPGGYDNDNMYKIGKGNGGFTMKGRYKDRAGNDNPGPGGYNPDANKIKEKAPGYGFGSPSKGGKNI